MQVTGTFPALSAGMKKSSPRRNSGKFNKPDSGLGGGGLRTKPRVHSAPKTFAGRRAASHAKAYGPK